MPSCDDAEVVHDVENADGMCQECAEGSRDEQHVPGNPAVHDETVCDT